MKKLTAIGILCILAIFNLSIFSTESYAAGTSVPASWELVQSHQIVHNHVASCTKTRLACTTPEHIHTNSSGACYEWYLSCTTPAHAHGSSCYTSYLSCGRTAHTHSGSCWQVWDTCDNCGQGPQAHYSGNPYGACGNYVAKQGYFCGYSEHTHTSACYSSRLSCTKMPHTHSAVGGACYSRRLSCTQAEHTHTDACYEEYYDCGYEEGEIVGTYKLYKEKSGAKYQLHLVVDGIEPSSITWLKDDSQLSTGTKICNVTRNATYSCSLNVSQTTYIANQFILRYVVTDYMNIYTLTAPTEVSVVDGKASVTIQVTFQSINGKPVKVIFPDVLKFVDEDGDEHVVAVEAKTLQFTGTNTKTVVYNISDLPKAGEYSATLEFTIDSGNH